MDYVKFSEQLPGLYVDWGSRSVRTRSERFARVLEAVRGMTSANVLQLLNLAVGCLEGEEVYCEVGCFQGATLIGALLDHPGRRAVAVDNFSEFDPYGQNHAVLLRNLFAFGLQDRVRFANDDFEGFLHDLRGGGLRVGAYFYDGAHDYRSQLLGLLLAAPILADRAVLVVDDSNCPAVRQATWDFLAARPEGRLLFDLPTPGNCDPTFWNGVSVLGWDAGGAHRYDRSTFAGARQPALLESLSTLQLVHVKAEGRWICLRRAE